MKKILCSVLLIISFMLLMPLMTIKNLQATKSVSASVKNIPVASKAAADVFNVCDQIENKTENMKADDYIFGVIAAEMPALYDTEALKAQAVAAYTYACYRRAENSEKTYDITTDSTTDQSYITEAKAREKWGDKQDEYSEKIKAAIKEVSSYMITYQGKPILSVYHAISSGKTEACKDIWNKDYPYLQPVASIGDKLSPDYISNFKISEEDLKNKFSGECEFSGKPEDYFKDIIRTDSGTVKEVKICGKSVTGSKVRSVLNLRSSNFEVSFADSVFTFTVYGYGHGVGMSQYGANYMAKQGNDFKEILKHYYTGCDVKKIS